MKKILFFLSVMLMFNLTATAKDNVQTEKRIEAGYEKLLVAQKNTVRDFKIRKKTLESELIAMKETLNNKNKMMAKLEKDSEIRWHRDKYKKLLKEYKHYYMVLENKIKETKEQINELSKLIKVM